MKSDSFITYYKTNLIIRIFFCKTDLNAAKDILTNFPGLDLFFYQIFNPIFRNYLVAFKFTVGLSSLGVPGVPWHTQILADQLTLFQPGGQIMPT